MGQYELTVVMPVYNEEACICGVVDAWQAELTRLGIDFRIMIINDGSRDATGEMLAVYRGNTRIEVISKENSGHGPTILHGYRLAVDLAEWVFQTDSDDEMKPVHFVKLWEERQRYSALFGCRSGRQQNSGRRFISAVSRLAVNLLFGPGIKDVNTPYRLMRSEVLGKIIAAVPADTFAPNILVSGVLAASGLPVMNLPVPHEGRKSGTVSIVKWRLWRAAARSLLQTLMFSFRRIKVQGKGAR